MPQVGYTDAQRKRMTGILIVIGIVLLAFGVWLIILGSGYAAIADRRRQSLLYACLRSIRS